MEKDVHDKIRLSVTLSNLRVPVRRGGSASTILLLLNDFA
jgi:hypothetical protein